MQQIKELFDPGKDIYRTIEKVVTFGNLDKSAIKREVAEYVVTPRIKENFEKILDALYTGMNDGTTEIGIWVSGFYGSGKSSFSKYLGLALDKSMEIEGLPFSERLANRINYLPASQLLKNIILQHDPAVFMIDLATQQISGYDLAPVSTIVYNEVMKWAGYAAESKIALLERTLEMDDRLAEFKQKVREGKGVDWDDIKFRDILRAKGIAQDMACHFYPTIWPDRRAFNVMQIDDIENERERMQKMLDLIRKRKGKEKVLFIIDEVGQYISAKDQLILQLQGTMENLKDIGQGKAWLLATAQQTLTEDNPNARFNSDKLFKLNDRFPVKVEVEASDIKEITTQRLLGKSNEGTAMLKQLYQNHGERLRLITRLENTQGTPYKSTLDEKSFVDLYPFLPHHFDILLNLLGKLARKTGGVGLRSALRVIQDVLTERDKGQLAEARVGQLAHTVHIYNLLKSDIRKSYSHVVSSVEKVMDIYGEDSGQAEVAKSIGLLQILDDLFLSVENLAALMQPAVDSPPVLEEVRGIVQELKQSSSLTLKEIDGQLRFMTEAIISIEKEKDNLFISNTDTRRAIETQLEDLFKPVPTARIFNTKSVRTGIALNHEGRLFRLAEASEPIQTELRFVLRDRYQATTEEYIRQSTERGNANRIYLAALLEESLDNTLDEIARCQEMGSRRNRYNDKEIVDYLNSQLQEAEKLNAELRRRLVQAMENGVFIFRGKSLPVAGSNRKLNDACSQQLKEVAEKVYDKYRLAPHNVEGMLAQRLLDYEELKSVPSTLNPFDVIRGDGAIDLQAPALKEIEEFLRREGLVEGKKLLEYFEDSPYGWSKDTTRYLVTLLFLASAVKLRIGGEDIKVKGPKAVEALRNVNGFRRIGLSLFEEGKPSPEQVRIARDHLIVLTGDTPAPLHQKLAECVMAHFPRLRNRYATLEVQLANLELPGIERAQDIQGSIDLLLEADGSNAPFLLGKLDAPLFHNLKWAREAQRALDGGIVQKVQQLHQLRKSIANLPLTGIPGELVDDTDTLFAASDRILENDNFYEKEPELNEILADILSKAADYFQKFLDDENHKLRQQVENLKRRAAWRKLDQEQQSEFARRLPDSLRASRSGIEGIQEILNEQFGLSAELERVGREVEEVAREAEQVSGQDGKSVVPVTLHLPRQVDSKEELERIIQVLSSLKEQLDDKTILELNW